MLGWGLLVATDDSNGLHFNLNDWTGSLRVQTNYAGVVEQTCSNLPYGDGETCTQAPSETLYGGLDRDLESGLDHAMFRQYSSTFGRWTTPDPYAGSYNLYNPQSLNRYAYVNGGPLGAVDPLGLDDCPVSEVASPGRARANDDDGAGCDGVDAGGGGDNSGAGDNGGNGGDIVANADGTYSLTVNVPLYTVPSDMIEASSTTVNVYADADDYRLVNFAAFFSTSYIGAPNNSLPTPTRFRLTIPGTHYCGPGGSGTPTDRVDAACAAHDACYGNAGVSFLNNIGWPKTAQQTAAIQGCDAVLPGALRNISYPTSKEYGEATIVSTYFNLPSGYSLRPFW